MGNAQAATYNNLTPVFTALFAALLLGERFRPRQLIGAAVILTGVYLTRSGYRFFIRNRPDTSSRAGRGISSEEPKI